MAMCKRIPEELNIDPEMNKKIKLVKPIGSHKPTGAVLKISSELALNPNSPALPYHVDILNNHAEELARVQFINAMAMELPSVQHETWQSISSAASRLAHEMEQEFLD